jgi:small-conductance mechanosensitive channel
MLLEAARRTPDALKEPKPFILQTALDDFYAQYQLNIYIRDADSMPRIYSELHQNVQDVFNEEGVEIMSPHYQAVRDGNQITIPPSYLSGAKKV